MNRHGDTSRQGDGSGIVSGRSRQSHRKSCQAPGENIFVKSSSSNELCPDRVRCEARARDQRRHSGHARSTTPRDDETGRGQQAPGRWPRHRQPAPSRVSHWRRHVARGPGVGIRQLARHQRAHRADDETGRAPTAPGRWPQHPTTPLRAESSRSLARSRGEPAGRAPYEMRARKSCAVLVASRGDSRPPWPRSATPDRTRHQAPPPSRLPRDARGRGTAASFRLSRRSTRVWLER